MSSIASRASRTSRADKKRTNDTLGEDCPTVAAEEKKQRRGKSADDGILAPTAVMTAGGDLSVVMQIAAVAERKKNEGVKRDRLMDHDPNTLVYCAALHQKCRVLKKYKASFNVPYNGRNKTYNGMTVYEIAARSCAYNSLKKLFQLTNAKKKLNYDKLMELAAQYTKQKFSDSCEKQIKVMNLLLEKGAKPLVEERLPNYLHYDTDKCEYAQTEKAAVAVSDGSLKGRERRKIIDCLSDSYTPEGKEMPLVSLKLLKIKRQQESSKK